MTLEAALKALEDYRVKRAAKLPIYEPTREDQVFAAGSRLRHLAPRASNYRALFQFSQGNADVRAVCAQDAVFHFGDSLPSVHTNVR